MNEFRIKDRKIGSGEPVYIVAEMSANHNQSFDEAIRLVRAAKEIGADAIKLQTYTADTLTIDCDNSFFKIKGTLWEGQTLHSLYNTAHLPWEWQPELKKIADEIGLDCFSTPFDDTSVDFLEAMDVPAYKIASFESIDLPLLRKVAQTGKPIIMSTGMCTLAEIEEAVNAIRESGGNRLTLLKCTSAYPAPPEEMDLLTIPHLAETFGTPVGLSDHTLGISVPVAAVALGACMIEKHFTLTRASGGPDSAFSLEPAEFKAMVDAVRVTEKALGRVHYGVRGQDAGSRVFRRSLFVVKNVRAGEIFTPDNVRSIRPGHGLHPRHLDEVLGKRASTDIPRGTPMSWSLITAA